MKIAFLNDVAYEYAIGSPKAVGGTERDIWILSRALAAAGWEVVVGVCGVIGTGQRRNIEGVEYVGINPGNPIVAWNRFLVSERPDWLFWEGASHWWGILVELAKRRNVRTVFHTAFDTDVTPRHALVRRSSWWPLYAWGLQRTDRIFVQHTGQFDLLPSKWKCKSEVLPKVCQLPLAMKPHSARSPYIAWVAMLRTPKRPDLLVEIAKKSPHLKFVVCGGLTTHRSQGDSTARAAESLKQLTNVDYRGRVDSGEAAEVIENAALLLCTSDQEGFPNTFVQAWSHGTPVVTLRVDPDNLIKQRSLGRVTGTVDATVEQLQELMAGTQERQAMAIRARQYILEQHSTEVVVKTFDSATRHRI